MKKIHEVRFGMSLVYAETWPEADGFAYKAFGGEVEGWAQTRQEALREMREDMRIRERSGR